MFLNILALITAVSISIVSAYYSIIGLTSIFSGVLIPIVIMGSVLEFGKIITTVWIHVNWDKIGWLIRIYLSTAVVVLMFITSMGIFGFLSRAHIDATSSVGDNQLIIEQLDQQIAVERQRIIDSQRVIAQMDSAINNILSQSTNAKTIENQRGSQIATQANTLRNSQKKERDALNKTIDDTNKRIAEINSQRLKLQQSQAKVESEVGPIKYIAQLIYGDTVNKDLLERAVRWVIIIIVAVFDPLAVCLILAVTKSLSSRKEINNETNRQKNSIDDRGSPQEDQTGTGSTEHTTADSTASIDKLDENRIKIIEKPVIEYRTIEVEKIVEIEKPVEIFTRVEIEKIVEVPVEIEKIIEVEKIVEVIKEVQVPVEITETERMAELATEIDGLLTDLKLKNNIIAQLNAQVDVLTDVQDYKTLNDAGIGNQFPEEKSMGQLFCLVERGTIKVFKWNNEKWIPVNKEQNDSYLLDKSVLLNAIVLLSSGELLWEMLTEDEHEAIRPLLTHSKSGPSIFW